MEISIIIPTLGYDCLLTTIEYLNKEDFKPGEIIVCIPEGYDFNKKILIYNNVLILRTKVKGQVQQRIEGFKIAKFKFVMQLDDDLLITRNDIEYLITDLNKIGINNAIAPIFLDYKTKSSIFNLRKGVKGFYDNLFCFFIKGSKWGKARMGTISKSGDNFGVNYESLNFNDLKNVEWLPGGCVIYHQVDLIIDNYFPFEGKAYCEDLFHSYLLISNNVKLWLSKKSVCLIKIDQDDDVRNLSKIFEIKKRFNKIRNRNNIRLYIIYLYKIIRIKLTFR